MEDKRDNIIWNKGKDLWTLDNRVGVTRDITLDEYIPLYLGVPVEPNNEKRAK